MWGIDGDTIEGALASDKIIVSVEKIISNSKIKESPEKTVIPSHRVSNIIELPWGAYPSYVSGYYSRDDDHYIEYDTTSRDEDKLSSYLKNWVHDARNIQEYKKLIGSRKIKELEEQLALLSKQQREKNKLPRTLANIIGFAGITYFKKKAP